MKGSSPSAGRRLLQVLLCSNLSLQQPASPNHPRVCCQQHGRLAIGGVEEEEEEEAAPLFVVLLSKDTHLLPDGSSSSSSSTRCLLFKCMCKSEL